MSSRGNMGFSSDRTNVGVAGCLHNTRSKGLVGDLGGAEYRLLSNIGLENRVVFSSQEDYDRFEAYLYLLNAVDGPRASNFFLNGREKEIFTAARGEQLVAIGAYSFTAKSFHVLATPLVPKGISRFMQKLQTAYTMFYNIKYMRSGRVFHSTYVSEEAHSERDLKYLFALTHLQPALLFDADWKSKEGIDLHALATSALKYRYSSIQEYISDKHVITNPAQYPKFALRARDAATLVRFWEQRLKH